MRKNLTWAVPLLIKLSLLGACQAGPDAEEGAHQGPQKGPKTAERQVEHSSEGVVGPDEAFFASVYLEQIFQYSKSHAKPEINPGFTLTGDLESLNAFEFDANFSESRLRLMALALLSLGDLDHDAVLSEAEFLNLRLDPKIFGSTGDQLQHQYNRELYQQAAGEQATLGSEELKSLLRGFGPLLKQVANQKSAKEQRLGLIRAWEKVLQAYDKDQDGTLSSSEQRGLRQDRSKILARLQG